MSTATMRRSHATRIAPLGATAIRARRWPVRLFDTLLAWQERAGQRHRLEQLDDRMLRDMGLSRADVAAEAAKPFWRP